MMSLTVNIVSYRYGHLVAQAIESVLCQTEPATVIQVFDDGVGDCRHVEKLYPEVNFIERPNNLGVVGSFQDALNHTHTERCMMLGADNWLRGDALAALTKFEQDIVSYDITLFGTDSQEFGKAVGAKGPMLGHPVWRFRRGDITKGNYIHGSAIFNVEMAKRFGYKASGREHTEEDWMLWQAMLTEGGATHHHHPEPFLYYRRHRQNFNQLLYPQK